MKSLLDQEFCKYAIENHILSAKIIEACRNFNPFVPVRDILLWKEILSLDQYKKILLEIPKNFEKEEIDEEFFSCAIQKKLIAPSLSQKEAMDSHSKRESLLLSNSISYETYVSILQSLIEGKEESKKSGKTTLIDGEIPKKILQQDGIFEETFVDKEAVKQKDVSDETVIDVLPDFAPENLPEKKLPIPSFLEKKEILRDESAETILDQNFEERLQEENSVQHISFSATKISIPEKIFTPEKKQNFSDESAETLVDQVVESQEKNSCKITDKIDSSQSEFQEGLPDIAKTFSKNEKMDIKPQSNVDATLELSYSDVSSNATNADMPSKEIVKELSETSEIRKSFLSSEATPPSSFRKTGERAYAEASEKLLTEPLIQTMMREVTRELNLQTQQVDKNISEKLSSYRLLMGVFVFVALFLIMFTIVIEWQRIKEMNKLRQDKDEAMQEKQILALDKEKIQNEVLRDIKKLYTEKKEFEDNCKKLQEQWNAEKENLAKLHTEELERIKKESAQKIQALEEMHTLKDSNICYDLASIYYEQKKFQQSLYHLNQAFSLSHEKEEKSKLHALRSLIYLETKEIEKASQEFKEAEKNLAKTKNLEALLFMAKYWEIKKDYAKAISLLNEASKINSPLVWKVYLAKGNVYFLDQKNQKNAAKEWEKAMKIFLEVK